MTDDVQTVPINRGKKTVEKPKQFVKHVSPVSYESDESDLMPMLKKPAPVEVTLADASAVKVAGTETGRRVYQAAARPKLFFSGNVTVSDVPDEDEAEDEVVATHMALDSKEAAAASTQSTNSKRKTKKTPPAPSSGRKLSVTDHSKDEKSVPVEHATMLRNPHGIIGMRRARVSNRNPLGGTLKLDAREVTSVSTPSTVLPVVIVIMAIAAGAGTVAAMLGFAAEVTEVSGVVHESITYSLDGLGASVRDAWSR